MISIVIVINQCNYLTFDFVISNKDCDSECPEWYYLCTSNQIFLEDKSVMALNPSDFGCVWSNACLSYLFICTQSELKNVIAKLLHYRWSYNDVQCTQFKQLEFVRSSNQFNIERNWSCVHCSGGDHTVLAVWQQHAIISYKHTNI